MEYIRFYNMPHYYILLTYQVINYTLLGIVRDSRWFDLSFAPAGLIWQRIGSYWDQNFILDSLTKMYNNKEEELEIHRLAIYPQQYCGAWS